LANNSYSRSVEYVDDVALRNSAQRLDRKSSREKSGPARNGIWFCDINICMDMSVIEDSVCNKIQQRAEVGFDKYGVTMERGDLTDVQWLTHLQEEMMDALVYLEKIISLQKQAKEEIGNWCHPNDEK